MRQVREFAGLFRYALPILLSAFLLFQIQPLIAKRILPWFGGTPALWTTCMLFFQALLLAGYVYSHILTRYTRAGRQALVHLTLLSLSLSQLPVALPGPWKLAEAAAPTWGILGLLAVSIGGPYLVLAATGPLLQSWLHRTHSGASPYRLYALSNLGSLIALLSYPFVLEPTVSLKNQSALWSAGYAIFVAACGWCAIRLLRSDAARAARVPQAERVTGTRPSAWDRLGWFTSAGCASVVLLATTNQVCQDVAVVPLLWVVPLALYLLSFVLTFGSERGYDRRVWGTLFLIFLGLGAATPFAGDHLPLVPKIAIDCALLFTACMVCHGELVRRKPDPNHLTAFYLFVAAGGAGGGAFVTLLAPSLFRFFAEFPLGLMASYLLFLTLLLRDPASQLHRGRPVWAWAGLVVLGWLLGVAFFVSCGSSGDAMTARSFYGIHRVVDVDPGGANWKRRFMHGSTLHGLQFVRDERRLLPLSYYGPQSGIGLVLNHRSAGSQQGRRIGVLGLGVGTLA
ncbi:MAG: hypothetical protein JRS35_14515, partial [Deltaproteobacteria bacterium]|nr:hypothetical protein [Deltaproteobacteria bacterium]